MAGKELDHHPSAVSFASTGSGVRSILAGGGENRYSPLAKSEDDVSRPGSSGSEAGGFHPPQRCRRRHRHHHHQGRRRRQPWRGCLICGSLWAVTMLAVVLMLHLALAVGRSLWGLDDDDRTFVRWGRPGTGTEDLAWYPTDLLRDVVPIPCHSHNDYWRLVPLFSALHAGCTGVEADVWLYDQGATLYVGHDTAALQPSRTFESLYVKPLLDLLNQSNPATRFYNDSRRGVFDVDPDQTLTLLVDVKTEGAKTWAEVSRQLEPLRSRGWLSFVEDGEFHKRQVTVVGTGNTPFDSITENSTYRDTFFDAPLAKMADESGPNYNQTNSYYSSVSFFAAVGFVWSTPSDHQLQLIRHQVQVAHERGLKTRYWDLPAWPIRRRNAIWHLLMSEGVDMLNVDDLRGASRLSW